MTMSHVSNKMLILSLLRLLFNCLEGFTLRRTKTDIDGMVKREREERKRHREKNKKQERGGKKENKKKKEKKKQICLRVENV